jgi:Cu2+-exporting ATPase
VGCHAVTKAIVDAGHQDYYRHRQSYAMRKSDEEWQQLLKQSQVLDREDIQRGFVRDTGKGREVWLVLEDIRCSACIWLNEQHLRQLPGVVDIEADFAAHRLQVHWNPDVISLSEIIQAIAAMGYVAHPYNPKHSRELDKLKKQRSLERVIFAAILGMVVMHFSLTSYLLTDLDSEGNLPLWQIIGRWTGMLVATAILVWPGQEFFVNAWRDIRHRRLGMDIPVVIGLLLAWTGSLASTIAQRGDVYLDSIAMFVFLLLLSRHIELKSRVSAAASLDYMHRVIPEMAQCKRDGEIQSIAVADLEIGDQIHLKPGERVPLDAVLLEQAAAFDESLITGESQLVQHAPGDTVLGGSINGDQAVCLAVKELAQDSCISQLTRLAQSGAANKPEIARLSDQVARYFVRVILTVALVTSIYYLTVDPENALETVIAVLIVTCPCALALATPVATSIAAGRLMQNAVVPLRMSAFEALAHVDTVILDKTGTMTTGKPELLSTHLMDGTGNPDTVLRIAAALESRSEHPLASAFNGHQPLQAMLDDMQDYQAIPGKGVQAEWQGHTWMMGSAEQLALESMDENQIKVLSIAEAGRSQGMQSIALQKDGQTLAIFYLRDQLRDGLQDALRRLTSMGLELHIVSGDNKANVAAVVDGLPARFSSVHAGHSPEEKRSVLHMLQQQGHKVLMVGDGINDSPVLAQADASVSFVGAPDLARANADFLIAGKHFGHLVDAIQLAQRTYRITRSNLTWAATYNLLALPLAMAGFIPAWGAALGMSLSSLFVVMNANRLSRSS